MFGAAIPKSFILLKMLQTLFTIASMPSSGPATAAKLA